MPLNQTTFLLQRIVASVVGIPLFINALLHMAFLFLFFDDKSKPELTSPSSPLPLWLELRGTITTINAWMADAVVYLCGCLTDAASYPLIDMFQFSYPSPFTQVWVRVAKDMELSCQVGAAAKGSPTKTIILVPGMFNCGSFSIIVSIATWIQSKWNANVIVVDLRSHGKTGRRYQDVPFSLTVLEARDLLEVAKFAKTTFKTDSIFLLGISLGGASVLSAAVQGSDASNLITACATLAAPMDLDNLLVTMSQGTFNIWFMFYTWILNIFCRCRGIGWHEANSFYSYTENIVRPYYAKEFAQALKSTDQRISPMLRLQGLEVPFLALHSRDDPVATMEEPLHLARIAKAKGKEDLVKVQITETGGHVGNFSDVQGEIYQFFTNAERRQDS